jgi:hypothetical protein
MAIIRRILIAFACFAAIPASAQTTTTEGGAGTTTSFSDNVFGVGLNASLCSGMGLAFRHHLPNVPLAYQLAGGAIKSSDLLLWDLGLEVQLDLSVADNRLYAVVAGGYYYYGKSGNDANSPNRFGAGIGYEIPFNKSVGMSMNLMLTLFEPEGDVMPLPSVGMLIYFK